MVVQMTSAKVLQVMMMQLVGQTGADGGGGGEPGGGRGGVKNCWSRRRWA